MELDKSPFKIGYTKNKDTLKKRIKQLQIGNPFPLKLEAVVEGSLQQEQQIHKKFKVYSLWHNKEWYRPTQEINNFVKQCHLIK
jgi:hypothetical protein